MKKHYLQALLSGFLMALAWPTYGLAALAFVGLVPLLLMEHQISLFSEQKHNGKSVFYYSFIAFFIWNIIATGWLYEARNPDGSHALPAVLGPVIGNSLILSLMFLGYHHYKKRAGTYLGLVFFVVFWLMMERFTQSTEIAWPWLNLGHVFANNIMWIQWYEATGVVGGSLWVLLVNVAVFYTYRLWQASRNAKALKKHLAMVVALILVPIGYSYVVYHQVKLKPVGTLKARLLQPATDPYHQKYQTDSLTTTKDLLALAGKKSPHGFVPQLYLAPETYLPGQGYMLENSLPKSTIVHEIQSFLKSHQGADFLTGAASFKTFKTEKEAPKTAEFMPNQVRWIDRYNSAIQINAQQVPQIYHKEKLVAGVEIMPYAAYIKPLMGEEMLNFGGGMNSLGTSNSQWLMKTKNTLHAPIICYESVFGELVADRVKKGAQVISVITNDSWWGNSQGHQQLLAYARLRAIECRREVLRSANSGISAHIDARGELLEELPYGQKDCLDVEAQCYEAQSPYVKYGDVIYRMALLAFGFLLVYILLYKKLIKKSKKVAC
jgi:apolipoprotein N-acyltransferase